MLTISCPVCQMSLRVEPELAGSKTSCPGCNVPFQIPVPQAIVSQSPAAPKNAKEETLLTLQPAMFRSRPITFAIYFVLIPLFGLGLILLLEWWLRCRSQTLTVTTRRTTLCSGILAKHLNEIAHRNVRNIMTKQSLQQRIFGVGAIGISSAGTSRVEIQLDGIRNPISVKSTIDQYAYKQS